MQDKMKKILNVNITFQVQTESADDVYSLAELMKTVLDEAVSAGKLEEDTAKEMTMSGKCRVVRL